MYTQRLSSQLLIEVRNIIVNKQYLGCRIESGLQSEASMKRGFYYVRTGRRSGCTNGGFVVTVSASCLSLARLSDYMCLSGSVKNETCIQLFQRLWRTRRKNTINIGFQDCSSPIMADDWCCFFPAMRRWYHGVSCLTVQHLVYIEICS
jgi:hypothetical protein